MDAKTLLIQALGAHIEKQTAPPEGNGRKEPFSKSLLEVPGVELIDFWATSNCAEENKVWEHPLVAAQTDKDFDDFCAYGSPYYFCTLHDVGMEYTDAGDRLTLVFTYGRLGNASEYNIRMSKGWEAFYYISNQWSRTTRLARASLLRLYGCDIPLQPGEDGYQEELFT